MVSRKTLVCDSCGAKIVTRTQIGYGDRQVHAFPCPRCGIGITYGLDLDQERGGGSYDDLPDNAHWVEDEDGADHWLAFSAELTIPKDAVETNQMGLTPFMSSFGRFENFEAFQHDEVGRRMIKTELPPLLDKLRVHFERDAGDLFRAAAEELGEKPSPESKTEQLSVIRKASSLIRAAFAIPHPGWLTEIHQRFAAATAKSSSKISFQLLTKDYLDSGRSLDLWRQINGNQRKVLECAPDFSPALQPVRYWKKTPKDLSDYVISNKSFDSLKQLYIDAFETLARIAVLAAAVEGIAATGRPELKTKKGSMSVWDFERMATANKIPHMSKLRIGHMFSPYMDTALRNGIGHNSAHYDAASDYVIWTTHGTGQQEIPYTSFVVRVLEVVSALLHAQEYCYVMWTLNNGAVGLTGEA